jgi:hypothetical protein
LSAERKQQLDAALALPEAREAVIAIQKALDPICLAGVNINPESRVSVVRGEATAELNEQGWRIYLVKVHNQAGVTAALAVRSPNAEPLYFRSSGRPDPPSRVTPAEVPDRWLDVQTFDQQPLNPTLSGLGAEYRIVQL